MDSVSLLLRTAIRTFYPTPRHILILDALLLHKVLHLEDLNVLLASQSKEVRTVLNPLRAARFVSTHTRREVRVTAASAAASAAAAAAAASSSSFSYGDRTVQRDYYYINVLEAIDAVKYRIAKLRKQIESAYKADAEAEAQGMNKDWYCPRCRSEYDMMTVLGFEQGPDGFVCEKCSQTLVQDEERIKERGGGGGGGGRNGGGGRGGGGHRKMKRLNEQLARLDELIGSVDRDVELGRVKVHEVVGPDGRGDGGFEHAWEERVRVRRADDPTGTGGTGSSDRYVDVRKREKGPDAVRAENLEVRIRTEGEVGEEERRREEERRERIRKQNEMPEWHKGSAIGRDAASLAPGAALIKAEEDVGSIKAEGEEARKGDSKQAEMDEQMQQYVALIEEERAEEERKKKQAAEEEEEEEDDDEDDEDDEDDGFEDALGTSVAGTPLSTATLDVNNSNNNNSSSKHNIKPSTAAAAANGLKRELEEDSSEAATPMSVAPAEAKRIKVEHTAAASAPDSEEGEDFEDV